MREEELGLDEVGCGQGLGYGVLDLEAGIRFEEVVGVGWRVDEEFEGAEGEVGELWGG